MGVDVMPPLFHGEDFSRTDSARAATMQVNDARLLCADSSTRLEVFQRTYWNTSIYAVPPAVRTEYSARTGTSAAIPGP